MTTLVGLPQATARDYDVPYETEAAVEALFILLLS
jgi:hypothetical protein